MNDPLLDQQLGSYRLIRTLGQGSFAQVYLGQHVYLETTYAAVKVLHAQLGAQEEQDFRKEALLLMKLKNSHIIRMLDYGVTNNRPFIVMELAKKGSLNKIYPRGSRLPLLEVVAYVTQIADGLDYAHKQNVVHRDIKPENILVGDNDELLLADFGIAKLLSTSRSNVTTKLAGTLTYMAPEQIMGQPVPASDQYALGIMVYEWLTGRSPFQGVVAEIIGQHLKSSPPLLRQYNQEISSDIEWAVLMALKKEPAQRFRGIQAFANALRQAARIEPTQLTGVKPDLRRQVGGSQARSDSSVVRQTGPGNAQANARAGDNQKPGMLYIPNNSPLPFTTLPSLPQAHFTEFWWPTFIVSTDERRAINQAGLPLEQLGSLGPLTGFPSQPVPLPTSSSVGPLSLGSLNDMRCISKEVHSQPTSTPQTRAGVGQQGGQGIGVGGGGQQVGAAGAAAGGQVGVKRTTGGVQQPSQGTGSTGTQQKITASPAATFWAVMAILALSISVICTLVALNPSNRAALGGSWTLVILSIIANIAALVKAQKHRTLKGWLIFFLILAITMLLINIPVQIHANSYYYY